MGRPDVNFSIFIRANLILVQFNHIRDDCLFNTRCYGIYNRPHGLKVVCLVSHPSGGSSELACAMGINPGPFFFHGFLRPISRAREIENDAFHGHFTGISRANY